MKNSIAIIPLTKDTIEVYIRVGKASYTQHYMHLWKNRDPSPYINNSFTLDVLHKEMEDDNIGSFIIQDEEQPVGILKIIKDCSVATFPKEEALLLEKIYILKQYSGKGIGKQIIHFVETYARKLGKRILWLDAMANSPALQFYLKNGFYKAHTIKHPSPEVKKKERLMYVMVKELTFDDL
ncbi:MAG: GNAT family N-acetyltransferase [Saonia sp.]